MEQGVKPTPNGDVGTLSLPDDSVRERILVVAHALFAAKGFSATSVREIAEGVGVSIPALYYHYGSKRGVLLALVERHCSCVTEAVSEALAGGDEDAHDEGRGDRPAGCPDDRRVVGPEGGQGRFQRRLSAGLVAYVGSLSTQAGTSTLARRDPSLFVDAEIRERIDGVEKELVAQLATVLVEGMAAGDFRDVDADTTAPLLLAAARGVHVSHGLRERYGDPVAMGRSLAELLVRGIQA